MKRFFVLLCLLMLGRNLLAAGLPAHEVALVGRFGRGPVEQPVQVDATRFAALFGSADPAAWPAEMQARQYFRNGGGSLEIVRIDPALPLADALAGRFQADSPRGAGWVHPFSDLGILLIPELAALAPARRDPILEALRPLADARHFMLLLDPPAGVTDTAGALAWSAGLPQDLDFAAALYPRVLVDPASFSGGSSALRISIGGSGSVAPVILRKDSADGIWESPAGTTAVIAVEGLDPAVPSTDQTALNVAHLCLIRHFDAYGHILFGARSRDLVDAENRYFPTTRLRRWIGHSLRRELADAADDANNPALWTSLKARSENFLDDLFRQGAFVGTTPAQAYFVACDATTTTANDVQNHRAHVLVGMAPLSPAEFQITRVTLATADPARPVPTGVLLMTAPVDGSFRLFHTTAPGFKHRLSSSLTLGPPPWFAGTPVAGDGGWRASGGLVSGPRQFFRLVSE
jgi:hypothetical protein